MEVNIIYEDHHILVCEKPAGIPSQTRRSGEKDMVSILKNYLYEKEPGKGEPYLGLIHRLDQPVQGLMVYAKTLFAARELNKQVTDKTMKKLYLAVAWGEIQEKQGIMCDYLLKNGKQNISAVVTAKTPGGKKSELKYRVLDQADRKNLIEIELLTGRHHQIRVQMSHRGIPLEGDTKYGYRMEEGATSGEIGLCAYRLEFIHPKTKNPVNFQIKPGGKAFSQFMSSVQYTSV